MACGPVIVVRPIAATSKIEITGDTLSVREVHRRVARYVGEHRRPRVCATRRGARREFRLGQRGLVSSCSIGWR